MNEPIKGRISREALQEWLNGSTPLLQSKKNNVVFYTFLKVPKQDQIEYIFGQENYQGSGVGWHDDFEFCGAYSRQTQMLRLADGPLQNAVEWLTPEDQMDFEELLKQVNSQINARVEEIVGNDRKNLPVREVTSESLGKKLQEYREYYAGEDATRAFFASSGPDTQFHSRYSPDQWTEENMTGYLSDPDGYVQSQAEDYIAQNGEELLEQFLEHDVLAEVFGKLEVDTDSSLHKMRAITQALDQCGAKTVNVTVEKDGVELTFKTAATSLKGYREYYSTWQIPATDRKEFYESFGSNARYTADDITKITYGRSTIYEAPPAPAEEMGKDFELGGMSL